MIYTGYYSLVHKYTQAGLKLISISFSEPLLMPLDGKIPSLAPDKQILFDFKNGVIDEMEYTSRYLTQLDNIGIREILRSIHRYGDDVVLLCWEHPSKFCHRHILADYINKRTKLNIEEYPNGKSTVQI